jgi:CHAT domain-containing protein/predicted negative regulator of RcsB-dependent stress response
MNLSSQLRSSMVLLCAAVAVGAMPQTDASGSSFVDLDKRGESLIVKGDFSKAEAYYREALDQARQKGERSWTAEFLRRIGEVHQRMQDLKGALSWYEQALPIREELGQKPETAYLLVGTGRVKMSLGDLAGAAERIERGRALYAELGSVADEANARGLLAQIAMVRGEFEKADELYRALLSQYESLHQPSGIVANRATRSKLFFLRSRYRDSLTEAFAAIDVAGMAVKTLSEGDERRNILTNQANAFETAGNVYQRMIQPSRALDYYKQALQIYQQQPNKEGLASVLTNMGPLLIRLGRIDEAANMLEQALAVRRDIGNSANTASTLTTFAEAKLAQGKTEEARKAYEEALSLSRVGSPAQAVALYQLADIALNAGHLDDALPFSRRALEARQRFPYDVVRSWIQIAVIHERRGEWSDAETALRQALSGFEKLTLEVSDPVQLASFRETSARLYPTYTRVLFRQGKVEEALLMAEQGRGQVLSRLYGNRRAGFADLLTPDERVKWEQATSSLAKAANRFRTAIEQDAADAERSGANAAWLDATIALSRTRDRIYSENARLQNQDGPAPAGLQAVLDLSKRNPRTLYLEWVVDGGSTLLFSLSSGEVRAYPLKAGNNELRRIAGGWRKTLVLGDGRGWKANTVSPADVRQESEWALELYRAALEPVAALIESGKWDHLLAVTDGPLLDVPLAALLTSRQKRLIDLCAVTSATSLRSLAVEPGRRVSSSQILIIDPLDPEHDRVVIPSGDRFKPLPYAQAEARSIAALFPGAVDLASARGRESQVKSRLDCCSILHFATHGVLDSDDGMDSGLLLAAEPENSTEDGILQAWEIAGMHLNARLAVLSACDTARGDRRPGEGLMGLAWAFQAAGTPAVIASNWSVNDAATADLMRAFYAELRSGARSDDALRTAMLKTRALPRKNAPFFWAAFSLIGRAESIR